MEQVTVTKPPGFPKIVCLIGAVKHTESYERAAYEETIAGNIVLSIGSTVHGDEAQEAYHKQRLDQLHDRKIDLADEVLVINDKNYIGVTTRTEIEYAFRTGKPVRYMFPIG